MNSILEARKEAALQGIRWVHAFEFGTLDDIYEALDELRAEAEELQSAIEQDIRNRDAK